MNLEYLDKHWIPIHNKKLEWAYKANKKFIDQIESDSVKNNLNSDLNKEISICTIGYAQVGKTSLILKLLEIKEEKFIELSKKLRGRSKQGSSATATAMIYSKSENEKFYYIENEKEEELCDLDSLEEKLKGLRNRVENNKIISSDKPIHIKIAKDYFEENANFSLRIIDLPGKGSSNKEEETHVEEILKTYSNVATTIIFVSRADNISDLKSLMESYSFTKYYPDKCAVVLTYSFSANSVVEELKKNGLMIDNFKCIINKSLEEMFADDFKKYNFFPLEYGDSMETKLGNSQAHEKEKIKEIVKEIFKDLKDKIQKSSSEYSKLMQNNELPRIIQRLKTEKEKESKEIEEKINKDENVLNEKIKKSNEEIKVYRKLHKELKEDIETKLGNIDKALNVGSLSLHYYDTERTKIPSIKEDMLEKFKKDLSNEVENIGKLGVSLNIEDDLKTVTSNFEKYFEKQNYKFRKDEYFPKIFDNFKNDKISCRKYIKKCIENVNEKIEKLKNDLIYKNKKLKNEVDLSHQKTELLIRGEEEIIEKEKEGFNKKKEFFDIEINKINKEIAQLEKDIKNAELFFNFLTDEFIEEKKSILHIEKNSSIEKKFFQFMNLALINAEYKNLEAVKG
jgi:hypothetical protein